MTELGNAMNISPRWPRWSVAGDAAVEGITLFTGARARVTVRCASALPGAAAQAGGIWFCRTDLGGVLIPALVRQVPRLRMDAGGAGGAGLSGRRTVLSADPGDPAAPSVQTVEHVLSALVGLGVTDALVEVDGPEVPIGDGSALPFVEAILRAGVVEYGRGVAGAEIRPLVVRRTVRVEEAGGGGALLIAEPLAPGEPERTHYRYELDYGSGLGVGGAIAPQSAHWQTGGMGGGESGGEAAAKVYAESVAPARTFSLLAEARAMRAMGMFTHLTPKEMLVLGPDGPVDNTLRFADEPARHKLLDLIGDLALTGGGRPIVGRVTGFRSGHALNHELARALQAQDE